MKYLPLLFLLIACGEGEGEKWQKEFDAMQITVEEAEAYIGKCFLHGSHSYQIVIKRNTTSDHQSMRDGWVEFCSLNKECDFRDESKCVITEHCGQSVSKEAIKYVLKRMNYYKEVECIK